MNQQNYTNYTNPQIPGQNYTNYTNPYPAQPYNTYGQQNYGYNSYAGQGSKTAVIKTDTIQDMQKYYICLFAGILAIILFIFNFLDIPAGYKIFFGILQLGGFGAGTYVRTHTKQDSTHKFAVAVQFINGLAAVLSFMFAIYWLV